MNAKQLATLITLKRVVWNLAESDVPVQSHFVKTLEKGMKNGGQPDGTSLEA